MSFVVDNGQIARLYTVRNPHKLNQLDDETMLAR